MLRIVGRLLLPVVSLAIVLTPAFATTESAAAATAVVTPRILAITKTSQGCTTEQVRAVRTLASAKKSKLQSYCYQLRALKKSVRTIVHHRLWIAPRYEHWWDIKKDKQWRSLVRQKRAKLRRIVNQDIPWVSGRIKALLPTPQPRLARDSVYYALFCIHTGILNGSRVGSGEGGWDSIGYDHGVATYFGGLQMDLSFMRSYGSEFYARWGTADHWPPWAQMQAASKAVRSGRGYYPWPNTARDCKLI